MGGYAYSVTDTTFLNIFGGGADCYIPDLLAGVGPAIKAGDGTTLNKFCFVVGILFALGIVIYTVLHRSYLRKNGYKLQSLPAEVIKTVIICAAIVWLFYKLAAYKGIPTALIWIAFILGLFAYITTKTTLGRNFYAVGGNEKATRLSGINTKMVMFKAYTLMGLLAGFAGVLNIARFVGAQPTYGTAYGGTGSIGGVIIGALMMGVINQGMDIMGTSSNYKLVVKGLVLMFAVFFDVVMKMRKKGGVKA